MKIVSYNSYGDLIVYVDESRIKRYTFWHVSPFHYRKIEGLLNKNKTGKAWQRLRKFHQAEIY